MFSQELAALCVESFSSKIKYVWCVWYNLADDTYFAIKLTFTRVNLKKVLMLLPRLVYNFSKLWWRRGTLSDPLFSSLHTILFANAIQKFHQMLSTFTYIKQSAKICRCIVLHEARQQNRGLILSLIFKSCCLGCFLCRVQRYLRVISLLFIFDVCKNISTGERTCETDTIL